MKGEIGVSETRQTRTDPLRGMVGGLLCVQLSTEPVLLFVDRRLTQQMGLPPAGTPVRELIPAEDWRPLVTQLHEALTEENELRFTARILPVPGEAPVEVHCSGRRWENLLWLAVAPSPGERMQSYEQIVGWYNGFRVLMESAPQQAYEWDLQKGTLTEAGFQSVLWREMMMTEPLLEVDEEGIPSAENIYLGDRAAFRQLHRSVLAGGAGGSVDLRMRTGYGTYRWCRLTLATLYDPDGKPRRAVALLVDIDEEKRENLLMAKRNERDLLTGLYNGETIRARLLAALEKLQTGCLAVYLVDIDHYQQVADQLGVLFGEAVLIGAADKLTAAAGEGAVLGRLGAITLIGFKPMPSRKAAVALGKTFCEKLCQRFADGKQELEVTASVGLVVANPGERDFFALVRQADLALAEAKRAGGGRLVTYRRGIPKKEEAADESLYFGESVPPDSAAGSFNDNMFYLFFNMLYEGEDPDRAIELVLRTAGQHFHVSRAYIYETEPEDLQIMRLTHEWCQEGIESLGEEMEYFVVETAERENRARREVYRCDDTNAPGVLTPQFTSQISRSGVRAFLQFTLLDHGSCQGFIGFDECTGARIWTDEELETLRQIARIVGGYLLRVRAQERRSRQDPITGLPGFPRFRRQAARVLESGEGGWMMINLDVVRFGRIATIFGEKTADRLLGRIGALLRERMQRGELACRVRRDEFVLLLRGREGETGPDRARQFERALAPAARALLGNYDLRLASGLCLLPKTGKVSVTTLYQRASAARKRAKRDGLGGHLYYNAEMDAEELRRREIERCGKKALDQGGFQLMLEPIQNVASGKLCGAQAVLCWEDPTLGAISEREYRPIFERCGLILRLEEELITQASALLGRWQRIGDPLPIAVTLSLLQFSQTDLIDRLTFALERAGIGPQLLRLQLAGDLQDWGGEAAVRMLRRLRQEGFQVSGGVQAPQSGSVGIEGDPLWDEIILSPDAFARSERDDRLAALIHLSHTMGQRVRAVGVREQREAERLSKAGCDLLQGDFVSPPLSPRAARTLLALRPEEKK